MLDRLAEAEGLLSAPGSSGTPDLIAPPVQDPPPGGIILPGRPSITLDSSRNIAIGANGLEIDYRGVDSCPYGRTATSNQKPFAAMVIHHTADTHDAEWYVQYQIDGDSARGGHFGYHFYIAQNGTIYQGAPFNKRTNHVSPASSVRYDTGSHVQNTNAIGISCVGAWNNNGFNPTDRQKKRVNELVFALADVFSISFSNIYGHGEIQSNRKKVEGTSLAQKIRQW